MAGCCDGTAADEDDERRMSGLETREASRRESMAGAVVVSAGDEGVCLVFPTE